MTNTKKTVFVLAIAVFFLSPLKMFAQELVSEDVLEKAVQDPFPSGLLAISDYKYPVFLYAPRGYRADRSYPMIMVAPSEGVGGEEGIAYWKSIADQNMVFVLSTAGVWVESDDVPTNLDTWLLQVKKDVQERFPVNDKKIYVAGKNTGAHYAAYLATNYPQEFAGAILLGQAWAGPFSRLIHLSSNLSKQQIFFVVFQSDQPHVKDQNQTWLDGLQEKGYPLKLVEVPDGKGFESLELKKEAYDWIEATGQSFSAAVEKSQRGFKAKFKKGVKDFFTV